MRLRQSIATPDRFDETVFRTKRRDPTKPQYPALLAAQVIPYNPGNKAAAFPSLSLESKKSHNKSDGNSANGCSLNAETSKNLPDEPACESEVGCKKESSVQKCESTLEIDPGRNAVGMCGTCNRELGIEWKSLSLSVQIHIFQTFLRKQKYVEIVANTLQLTYQELDDLKRQISLRKIYQAPLETIWTYGVTVGRLGDGAINPEDIEHIMDYLLFASRYEDADKAEIKRGRSFLQQLHFDDKIMNTFGEHNRDQRFRQVKVLETKPQVSFKRNRRRTASDIVIDLSTANSVDTRKFIPATAPANISTFDDAHFNQLTSPSSMKTPATHHSSGERPSDIMHKEQEQQPERKRLRLSIDNIGHASITSEDDHGRHVQPGFSALDPALVQAPKSTDNIDVISSGTGMHPMHNQRAFATHFNHNQFPQKERRRLLEQNPKQMSNLDHWFVYGSLWCFLEHMTEFGRVRKPLDRNFDPRKMSLDESQVKNGKLCHLVNLQNIWVRRNSWFGGKMEEIARMFDYMVESVMGDNGSLKKAEFTPSKTSLLRLKFDADQRDRNRQQHNVLQDKSVKNIPSTTDSNDTKQRTVHHPSTCTGHQPYHPPAIVTDDQQRFNQSITPGRDTPNDQGIKGHTGDTTINVHGTESLLNNEGAQGIEPGSIRRKLFGGDTALYLSPKAPSYSPVSDQDSQSLPVWSRHKKKPIAMVETSSAPATMTKQISYELSKTSGIQKNAFLQDLINAAAEDVLGVPDNHPTGLALQNVEVEVGSIHRGILATVQNEHSPDPLQKDPAARNETKVVSQNQAGLKEISSKKSHLDEDNEVQAQNLQSRNVNRPCGTSGEVSNMPSKAMASGSPHLVVPPTALFRGYQPHSAMRQVQTSQNQLPSSEELEKQKSKPPNKSTKSSNSSSKPLAETTSDGIAEPQSVTKHSLEQLEFELAGPEPRNRSSQESMTPKSKLSKVRTLKPKTTITSADTPTTTPLAPKVTAAPSTKKKRKDFGVKRGPYKKRGADSMRVAATVDGETETREDNDCDNVLSQESVGKHTRSSNKK